MQSLTDVEVGSVDEAVQVSDASLRVDMAKKLIQLFIFTNVAVLLLVVGIFVVDTLRNSGTIIITSQVVMTLISATTVQLGAIMLSVSSYLFPKPPKS